MSRICLTLVLAAGLVGCGGPDKLGAPLDNSGSDGGSAAASPGASGPTCPPEFPPTDPSTLPACCQGTGAAHCVPAGMLPASFSAQLTTCASGGSCVPDSLIASGGAKPPSCMSLGGAAGVCLSLCVPMVTQYMDLLPQDVCAADERCAPCINPLTNMPSGACEIGNQCAAAGGSADGGASPAPPAPPACPHVGPPVIDPSTLPSCYDGGGAHCVSATLVPPQMASELATCATGLCAPDVFISSGGQFIPPTCASLDGAEGRCLHVAIPEVAAQKDLLPQSSCQSYERCVPCYSPLDGSDTGACRQSCDPGPTKPAVTFAACCSENGVTNGKCVPDSAISQSLQQNLASDTCQKNTELCVPTENLQPDFKPKACSAFNLLAGNYTGVCLSDCLSFGIQGLAISRGDCDSDHKCAPCTNPLTGKPTGAPGCPTTP